MAWWEIIDRGTCGRPIKKSGLPCPRQNDEHLPTACYSHLTREERTERGRLAAEALAEREERYAAAEPNCWLWEVPTSTELRELFFRKFGGEAEVYRFDLARYLEDQEALAYFHFESWHDQRCAICGARPTPLVLDHDHRTGLIRGYLCRSCNFSEGMRRGEPAGPYAKYRERSPATMMGISMTYTNGWGQTVIDPPRRGTGWTDNPLRGIGM
jgi:hypothetical protein